MKKFPGRDDKQSDQGSGLKKVVESESKVQVGGRVFHVSFQEC
jgi:hypothetical protein